MSPYYEEDGITIYHGDCRDVLPSIPQVNAVITDPPYGVGIGGDHIDARGGRHGLGRIQPYEDYDDTYENLVAEIVPRFTEYLAVSQRAAVFTGRYLQDYPRADAVGGVYIPSASGRHCWGFNTLAPILLYGKAPDTNRGMKSVTLVSYDTSERNGHPCPKPVSWMRWLVSLATRENELIVDPFMGSGTTLRAAKDLGRKAIGCDLTESYCEIAANRLRQEVLTFA